MDMELVQVANFLNGRFLAGNLKIDKNAILNGKLLSTYSVGSISSSLQEDVYYDTDDFFFADRGINIYTTLVGSVKELIVRYDSEQVKRIEFLKNTPNFFKIKIGKDDGIDKYFNEINEAIYKVYPTGLNANIDDYLRQSRPQIRISKRRDMYRVVNNSGLKTTFSFDDCEYIKCTKKAKSSQATIDIVCDSYKLKDDFKKFLKDVVIDYPRIIQIESNELTVARNNLD